MSRKSYEQYTQRYFDRKESNVMPVKRQIDQEEIEEIYNRQWRI